MPQPRRVVRLSVIVPFAPHETEGALLLDRLQVLSGRTEVVPVRSDGGSLPKGLERAVQRLGACVCASPPGRARQLNVGAQAVHDH